MHAICYDLVWFLYAACIVSTNNLSSMPTVEWIGTQEDKTKSWKKLVNVAVSGAAGMISNHLLFKVTNLFIDSACFLSTRDALLYC